MSSAKRQYIVNAFIGGHGIRGLNATNLLFSTYDMSNTPIFNAVVEKEVNKVPSFKFTMGADHQMIDCPKPFRNWILVIQYAGTIVDGVWESVAESILFYGRIITVDTDLYGNKAITCEGCEGFFNDYIIREKDFWYYIEDGTQYIVTQTGHLLNNIVDASRLIVDAPDAPENPDSHHGALDFQDMINSNYKKFYTYDSWIQHVSIYDQDDGVDHDDDASVLTLMDVVNDDLLSNVGGVLYVNPSVVQELPSPNNVGIWTSIDEIQLCVYYYKERTDFGIGTGWGGVRRYGEYRQDPNYPQMDANLFPRFVLGENVINMSKEPAMDTIFTGAYPVGKNGLVLAPQSSPVGDMDFNDLYVWSNTAASKYGRIAIALEFPNITTRATLRKLAQRWVNAHTSDGLVDEYKYTITGPEPVMLGYGNYFIEVGAGILYTEDMTQTAAECKGYTCMNMSIDVFNPQNNQYTFGPFISENYSDTSISTKMSQVKSTKKAKKK